MNRGIKTAPTNSQRALYNTLRAFKMRGEFAKDAIITESYLRLETLLTSSQSITFNVLNNVGQSLSTEHRLSVPDAFVVSSFGFFIKKVPTGDTQAQSKLFTYPEPSVFSGTNEAKNLMNLYNGYLSVKIDQTTWIDSLDLFRFYRVGVSQQGLAASSAASANVYLNSEWSSEDWGYKLLEPSIKFDGGSNNDITITLPESLNVAGTASANYAVIIVRGYLIQRGSKLFAPKNFRK